MEMLVGAREGRGLAGDCSWTRDSASLEPWNDTQVHEQLMGQVRWSNSKQQCRVSKDSVEGCETGEAARELSACMICWDSAVERRF